MSRKDYVRVAGILNEWRKLLHKGYSCKGSEIERLAKELASWFHEDNSRFNIDKFMWACGFDDKVKA